MYILSLLQLYLLYLYPQIFTSCGRRETTTPPAEEVTANADTSSYTNILKQLEQPTGAAAATTKASTDGVKERNKFKYKTRYCIS